MTYLEKLKKEHPEAINDYCYSQCEGCPSQYSYVKDDEEVSICVTKDGIITFDLTELNEGLGKIQRVKDPIALLCVNDFCRPIDGNYKNSFDYQHNFDGVIILDA